jgi:hypothetical protein
MAIFEIPARLQISVPDEYNLDAGRRDLLAVLAEQWINTCSEFTLPNDLGNKKVIQLKVSVGAR